MNPISVKLSPEKAGPIIQRHTHLQDSTYVWRTQKFTATVENDYANNGVTWSIAQGGGAITEQGIFHPPMPGAPGVLSTSTVQATSVTDKTKSATAIVTYKNSGPGDPNS